MDDRLRTYNVTKVYRSKHWTETISGKQLAMEKISQWLEDRRIIALFISNVGYKKPKKRKKTEEELF